MRDTDTLARDVVIGTFIAEKDKQDASQQDSKIMLLLFSDQIPKGLHKAIERQQKECRKSPENEERQDIQEQPV